MGAKRPRPIVLDAGALIAVDRADRRVIRLLELAPGIHVPAGALAQAWRNPARQVRLVRVVASDGGVIHPLDAASAPAARQPVTDSTPGECGGRCWCRPPGKIIGPNSGPAPSERW